MKISPFGYGALIGLVLLLKPKKVDPGLFDSYFYKYADDPRLAKAVAKVESGLNPDALGDNGKAFGLMQIWHDTAKGHGYIGGAYGLLDPETNIYYATKELNLVTRKYGLFNGIQVYNLGETKWRKGYTNTAYLNKVLKANSEVSFVCPT